MKQFHKGKLAWALILSVAPGVLSADSIKFDFRDSKKVNNVVFLMDAPLESINGTATGVSGTVSFDPAKPAATTGKIVLATSSLHVDNPLMKKHMLDEGWMHGVQVPDNRVCCWENNQGQNQWDHHNRDNRWRS